MASEDLQRKNAILRDRIDEVLEVHPDLRDATEGIALNQDLHVQVGSSFLKRTQEKLLERARALIERRPELAYYCNDVISPRMVSEGDSHEAKLTAGAKGTRSAAC
jgi:hypothetical protein